ncbi:radical SAM family heme chaperone HemW [Niallia sp. Krafla_26]|uniref:radical SAM family heme chaperone HemW n=1 Tax=Niallia sp. Krafla_26 TaxID=3064703 RepID=UPI003D170404
MIQAAYIHIPFCEHICHYCDFNKVYLKGQPVDAYLEALGTEMKQIVEKTPTSSLNSIFVGGGTPTSLNERQLERLCAIIREYLPFFPDIEYTFEANPGDLSQEKLKVLFDGGVNRLSFGVQTFDEELLKKIGRTHNPDDVYESIAKAKKVGFQNINIDLMYSLPNQSIDQLKQTLQRSFALEVTHFSAYSLIIEPKTIFYQLMNKGKLQIPNEDEEAEMYHLLMNEMEKHGYHQYEISNFAKSGYESLHNLTYWNNDEYYGFGAGAHCYVNGVRSSNYGPIKKYINPLESGELPIMDAHVLSEKEKWEEEMFLGLRKVKGVSIERFITKFGKSPLDIFQQKLKELKEKGLLTIENGYIFLTRHGRFLGNEAFEAFLLDE